MANSIGSGAAAAEAADLLVQLQSTLDREIPICAQMGIRVVGLDERGLALAMPLAPNRNHRETAFAGSLSALCTVTGWASLLLLMRAQGQRESIVIRRSAIRYLQPVDTAEIVARCPPIERGVREHFFEMLREKGQAKIDLDVEIDAGGAPAVAFHGSYVALDDTTRAVDP